MQVPRSRLAVISALVPWVFPLAAQAQSVLYVDAASTSGLNNGSSWADAYLDLQDALQNAGTSASVNEIRVAQGEYRPDRGTGDAGLSFALVSGVALRGGFAGSNASDADQRDASAYVTVLSGDLAGNDDTVGRAENALHVVDASGVDGTAVLEDFVIRAGNADASVPHHSGGGMRNLNGRPTLVRCIFEENSAVQDGGAVFNSGRSAVATFTDCTFERNTAGGRGGALFNDNVGSAAQRSVLSSCAFRENAAPNGGAVYGLGGGMAMLGCLLQQNSASAEGGAVYNFTNDAVFEDCTFASNSAVDGGAIRNASSRPALARCLFTANTASDDGGAMLNQNAGPSLANCAFVGNAAGDEGGALWSFNTGSFTVRNCTFSDNFAGDRGGGLFNWGTTGGGSGPQLTSCVLWANRDGGGEDESGQMHTDRGSPTMNYSCLQGLTAALGGAGNTGADPQLEPDGWRLASTSPCVNSGDPVYAAPADETDLDGEPRVVNGRVDMGADEFGIADADSDGVADDADNCPSNANAGQEDADGDGAGDACDGCPNDPADDVDADGVCGDVDNCPANANSGQEDADGDSAGDACDTCPNDSADDGDGDGLCADADNCPTTANAGQEDADGDSAGDACDTCPTDADDDGDGDGRCADRDNCPAVANPSQENSDADTMGDACDPDDDNDGLSDDDELEIGTDPLSADTDRDGLPDGYEVNAAKQGGCPDPTLPDSDGDTLSDGDERAKGTDPCNEDTDGDGVPDNKDLKPTQPEVTSESLKDRLRELAKVTIPNLDLRLFNGPNKNAERARRSDLADRAAEAARATGRGNYRQAINELQALLSKIDGRPSPPDWMTDSPERAVLARAVGELIDQLRSLDDRHQGGFRCPPKPGRGHPQWD